MFLIGGVCGCRMDFNTSSLRKYASVLQAAGGWKWYQRLLRELRAVGDNHGGVSIANVASRWVLERDTVGALILGAVPHGHALPTWQAHCSNSYVLPRFESMPLQCCDMLRDVLKLRVAMLCGEHLPDTARALTFRGRDHTVNLTSCCPESSTSWPRGLCRAQVPATPATWQTTAPCSASSWMRRTTTASTQSWRFHSPQMATATPGSAVAASEILAA